MNLSIDDLLTLRLIVDAEVRMQGDMYYRARAREVKLKLDAEFNERLGFSSLTPSAAIMPIAMPSGTLREGRRAS